MKPVDQLFVHDGRGDCLRACVCSLLEIDPKFVPNFSEIGFFSGLREWLTILDKRILRIDFTASVKPEELGKHFYFPPDCLPEFMLVWGTSPRPKADGGRKQHIVIAKPNGYGIDFVHDPHPDRTNILDIDGVAWIVD
jgi:hypothetical protein